MVQTGADHNPPGVKIVGYRRFSKGERVVSVDCFFFGGGGAVVGMWHHGKIAACNVRFMRG